VDEEKSAPSAASLARAAYRDASALRTEREELCTELASAACPFHATCNRTACADPSRPEPARFHNFLARARPVRMGAVRGIFLTTRRGHEPPQPRASSEVRASASRGSE